MKITKFGHCCLLIEENGVRILTDPGSFTTAQNEVTGIDAVLITHEHGDHIHVDSLKGILKNNPHAQVVTNSAVATILESASIPFTLLNDSQQATIKTVLVEALEEQHAAIYGDIPRVLNTGFFIANRLFYPGDALIYPAKPVEILACPVAGPWIKLGESLEYAKTIQPKKLFPVHDAVLSPNGIEVTYRIAKMVLEREAITFITPQAGESFEV